MATTDLMPMRVGTFDGIVIHQHRMVHHMTSWPRPPVRVDLADKLACMQVAAEWSVAFYARSGEVSMYDHPLFPGEVWVVAPPVAERQLARASCRWNLGWLGGLF